jgi:hypothetical protein
LLDSAPEAILEKWCSYVAMLLDSAPESHLVEGMLFMVPLVNELVFVEVVVYFAL